MVGGKLTTYRRMAEDAVDAALAGPAWPASAVPHPRPAAARRRAPRRTSTGSPAPPRLVRRYGTEAAAVLANAREPRPVRGRAARPGRRRPGGDPGRAAWGVTHEGALDVDDLLDRRTRVGLVPADRALAEPAARLALAAASG